MGQRLLRELEESYGIWVKHAGMELGRRGDMVVRQESRGMEESRGFGGGIEAISWVEESINLWSGNEVSGRMRGC